MARPRRVLPGRTYLVTRRCSERRYFLKPSPLVTRIFTYCLAVAAARFGVLLHACTVMSNHHHIVLTDVHGVLPRFCHLLHSLVARITNFKYGRFESFWDPYSYSAVLLENPEDIIDKMGYVLANPVAAGLVKKGTDWPGFITTPKMLLGRPGQGITCERPEGFFVEGTPMPEKIELRFCCPPQLEEAMGKEAAAEALQARRMQKEEQARQRAAELGIPFLGRKRVVQQNPYAAPSTDAKRFQLSPNIACKCRWKRLELIEEQEEWYEDYETARRAFAAGRRSVLFPEGTWGPVVTYGARAKPPGTSPPDRPPGLPPDLPPPRAA